MTEWEKLVHNGFVSEDFLREETICEYTVSSKLKKLWAIELDLLREFKRVCDKYGLTYYAYAGTLLGAVRHHGFIPWDDDLDVCMPRKDYDILTRVYYDEFKEPYFLQTPYTDKEYAFSFAKLRNVNSCFASKTFIESPMNQGAFLDVFPLEDADEHFLKRREKILDVLSKCSAFMSRNNKYLQNKHSELAQKMTFSDNDNISFYEQIQTIAQSSDKASSKFRSIEVSTLYSAERRVWPKEYFDEAIELPFCDTTIKVPKEYDKVLSLMYKDYMQFPPVEQRGLRHSNTIISVDLSFDEIREKSLKDMENQLETNNALRGEK